MVQRKEEEIRIFRGTRPIKLAHLRKLHSIYMSMERRGQQAQYDKVLHKKGGLASVAMSGSSPGVSNDRVDKTVNAVFTFEDWLKLEYPEATALEMKLLSVAARKRDADPKTLAKAQRVFHKIDTEGKGQVSREELEDYCLREHGDVYLVMRTLPDGMKQQLYSKDSGRLSKEDFLRWYLSQYSPDNSSFEEPREKSGPMTLCVDLGKAST
eukprot:jgi/Tetstr1/438661/TSEL_027211.t1